MDRHSASASVPGEAIDGRCEQTPGYIGSSRKISHNSEITNKDREQEQQQEIDHTAYIPRGVALTKKKRVVADTAMRLSPMLFSLLPMVYDEAMESVEAGDE